MEDFLDGLKADFQTLCSEEVDARLKDLKKTDLALFGTRTPSPDMIKVLPPKQPEEEKPEENEPTSSENESFSSQAPKKMNLRNRGRPSIKPNKSKVAASGKKADKKRQVKEI